MKRSKAPPLVAVCALLLFAARAHATPRLRDEVRRSLSLTYDPPCSLCHVKGNTGGSTVNTPFGRSARAQGLMGDSANNLGAILTAMDALHIDSDDDGVADVPELKSNTDPNSPSMSPYATDTVPAWGCAYGGSPAGAGFATAALIAVLWFVRHREAKGSGVRG